MHMVVYNGVIRKYIPQLDLWAHFRNLDFDLVKSMLKAALPFGLLIGFSVIYNKIDVIILSHTRGYAETGLYTAAYKYFDLLSFVPAVVSSSLYPYFSTQIKEGKIENVRKALRNYTRYMIAMGMPIAFGGAVLAPALITILGGQEGYLGYLALQVLVVASAILFIYAAVNSLMVNQLTLIAVKISFANIFINGIGNLILVPRYGFQAAAFMTVFSELVQAAAYFYFIRKKVVDFEFERFLFKPLLASVVMAGLLYPIRNMPLYLTLPFGALVYAIAIYLLRFFDASDYKAIKGLLLRKTIAYDEEASRGV
jgi:O-antigen/teichoic acid export membrane protein